MFREAWKLRHTDEAVGVYFLNLASNPTSLTVAEEYVNALMLELIDKQERSEPLYTFFPL